MSKFEGVADTLFIPLTARIYMSRRFPEYFYDAKAMELADELPQDNSIEKNSNEYSMIASVARYYNLDEMVKKFIAAHPGCNLVNLGCGLETMYYRLGEQNAMFYEMDQPEVIEGRRKVLGEHENEKLIAGDLFDLFIIGNTVVFEVETKSRHAMRRVCYILASAYGFQHVFGNLSVICHFFYLLYTVLSKY